MAYAFWIRFRTAKAHERAIEAMMEVREPRHVFVGRQMLVTRAHIEALKKAGVPFDDLTDKPSDNGKKKKKKKTPLSS